MESNTLLVTAASGLEKLMTNNNKRGILKDSIVAQVSAAVYYQSHVMSKIMSSKPVQKKFQTIVFNQVEKDFYSFVDSMARMKPKQYHHVYEWGKTGDPKSRLFCLTKLTSEDFSARLTYDLKMSKSKVPNSKGKRSYVFANKATIMELGQPVVISPKYSERLVFDTKTHTVFMPKGRSVTVTKPGGVATKTSFYTAYKIFFTGNLVSESIKRSGFQNIFRSDLVKALKLPADIKRVKYSFSPNTVKAMAENSVNSIGVL